MFHEPCRTHHCLQVPVELLPAATDCGGQACIYRAVKVLQKKNVGAALPCFLKWGGLALAQYTLVKMCGFKCVRCILLQCNWFIDMVVQHHAWSMQDYLSRPFHVAQYFAISCSSFLKTCHLDHLGRVLFLFLCYPQTSSGNASTKN